ncbi:MAG: PLDc N-terminal domain-containing protein [Planctomycetota bacterium]|nr:PLDc N-terminal domain-containing protein [Planctomycetota bacterium]MDA0920995.1 PLDc N-terminal domain-containing protein [Planctomycetota bacterium]MDA1161369.1 PLDc N-terminal domain-containing protein [Planctomycetota bacterium]
MFSILCAMLIAVLDIFAIVEVVLSRRPLVEKVLWALVIAMLPLLGLIPYLLMGRGTRHRSHIV